MTDDLTTARAARDDAISRPECRAMRALDDAGAYTRSEIAFIFEARVPTVTAHVERECDHERARLPTGNGVDARKLRTYSDAELLNAYRATYDRQPYQRMSKAVYREYADADDPGAQAIADRFGGWTAAREVALEASDE